ncbi:MAG TPA: hypothetical protein VGP07_25235, partial [Polyangia bacterium]
MPKFPSAPPRASFALTTLGALGWILPLASFSCDGTGADASATPPNVSDEGAATQNGLNAING